MKTLIYFNRPDCPENMGISQLTDDVKTFLTERADILINPKIVDNIIEFTKPDDSTGFAIITNVPDEFQN